MSEQTEISQKLITKIFELFVNRDDVYSEQQPDNQYYPVHKPITKELLEDHLLGKTTIGIYCLNKENHVKWLCLDIDDDKVPNPEETAKNLYDYAAKRWEKERVLLEASSPNSFHIWVFFNPTIPADVARFIGELWTQKDSRIEVYPKQTELTEKLPYGNLIRIPLGFHKLKKIRSKFVDPETFEPLTPEVLFNIQTATIEEKEIVKFKQKIAEEKKPKVTREETKPIDVDIKKIPCVKAFREKSFPEGNRHNVLAKNYAILFFRVYGNWDNFEDYGDWLAENQEDFRGSEITKWDKWVETEKKEFNCIEVKKVIEAKINDFSCEGCPLRKLTVYEKYFEKDDKGKPTKFISKYLGDELLEKHKFLTMWDSGEIYYFNEGVYRPNGEALITQYTTEALEKEFTNHRVEEVKGYIAGKTREYFEDRSKLEAPLNLIPCLNGVLDISKEPYEILPYDPKIKFFSKIPVEYKPNTECPKFKKFLSEIEPKTIENKDATDTIQESFGYCLYRRYLINTILLLVGKGQNGKTTLINILIKMIGSENTSNQSLQELIWQPFSRAKVYGKLLNSFADLPDKALTDTGWFKALTGDDWLSARTLFHEAFNFMNYAKLVFSCNKIPRTEDQTDAFFSRFIIIQFFKQFLKENKDEKLQPIRGLADQIATPEELSGILNWALQGLQRLLKNGGFSNQPTIDQIKNIYIKYSDTIQGFRIERLEYDVNSIITKDDVYNDYVNYCYKLNRVPSDKTTFSKELPKFFEIPPRTIHKKIGDRRYWCWGGIKFKELTQEVLEIEE